jgi:hypothetical protein
MTQEDLGTRFVTAVERHAVDELRALLAAGLDVRRPVQGKPATTWLTEMYTRSDRAPAFLQLLLQHGAEVDDPLLAPVLLDDASTLESVLAVSPSLLAHRTTLASAFTPLHGASLLHVAAEYGCLQAARVLLAAGAEVDARAAIDEHGLGGHTPLFHTVNTNAGRGLPMLELLLAAGARTDVRIAGLTWGGGFDWETTLFDLTPVAYAQCGLLPQMHRDERQTWATVRRLLTAAERVVPPLGNVPNRYLQPRG